MIFSVNMTLIATSSASIENSRHVSGVHEVNPPSLDASARLLRICAASSSAAHESFSVLP